MDNRLQTPHQSHLDPVLIAIPNLRLFSVRFCHYTITRGVSLPLAGLALLLPFEKLRIEVLETVLIGYVRHRKVASA